MHLISSLLFLSMIMGLMAIYFFLMYVLIAMLNRFYVWIISVKGKPIKKKMPLYSKKYFSIAAISIFIITILPYAHSRKVWIDEESAYRNAKQYFVVGQVLANFRVLLTKKIHPENPLMLPFNKLQESIFNQGKKYLPDNDGEIGVWRDLWFLYPYIQVMHVPKGTSDTKPSYKMRSLLDDIWISIEEMAEFPIADKNIERKYFHNLPRLYFYYELNKGYYFEKLIGSSKQILNDMTQIERSKKMMLRLEKLKNLWIEDNIYEIIKTEKPIIEVLRLSGTIMVINNMLRSKIWSKSFKCNDPLVNKYIDTRHEFAGKNSENSAYDNLYEKNKNQAILCYEFAIDSLSSSFVKYILEKYCKRNVPGDEKFEKSRDVNFLIKMQKRNIELLLKDEIELIEEQIYS